MAVFEHTYRPYAGPQTPSWGRFLVIPRYAFQEVFKSKLFLTFFVVSLLPTLVGMAMIYVLSNETFLALFQLGADAQIDIDSAFFYRFTVSQGFLSFLVMVFVAPALVSADLANNALPLYLSRPFTRKEYVLGKMTVLLVLLSVTTWLPLLAMFALQGYMRKGWIGDNLWIAGSILTASGFWVVLVSLLGLAVSAWVKWKPVARLALFGIFFFSGALGQMINLLFLRRFDHPWGDLLNLFAAIRTVWRSLFRLPAGELPVWTAWGALFALIAICLLLLARRIRAYEVVR